MEENDVLFIDEIHRLPAAVEEYIYPAMEDRRIDFSLESGMHARVVTISLKPFTLIGATTRAGLLTQALRSRFGIAHHLEFYGHDDLVGILERASRILSMPGITTDAFDAIASRSRGTPRIAIRLLRRVRDFATVRGTGRADRAAVDGALKLEGIDARGLDDLDLALWPRGAPLTARSDWRPAKGLAGGSVELLRSQILEPFGTSIGILNTMFGAPALHNVDMVAALCRAANEWVAKEWLDHDPRLRAGILVPLEDPALAVQEIERRAADPRFVQVLLFGATETLLGRRNHWPIYEVAQRHDMPVALQVTSAVRHSPTANGWPSYLIEDHVNFAQTFQSQLLSMISEGVFTRFPKLKLVLLGAGIGWVPSFIWRGTKEWRALRREVPWVDRSPAQILRDHVRIS
jgi:predicted TIM-barrel fold metal-dependent hydrolase